MPATTKDRNAMFALLRRQGFATAVATTKQATVLREFADEGLVTLTEIPPLNAMDPGMVRGIVNGVWK